MTTPALSICPERTIQLHEQLAASAEERADVYLTALEHANRNMADQSTHLGQLKTLQVALSTLLLSNRDFAVLKTFADNVHEIVERVLDHLNNSGQLAELFPDHLRILPFLQKTAGADSWQIISRYDVAVTPNGSLKLMELNTGCPGAMMTSEILSRVTQQAFRRLQEPTIEPYATIGAVSPSGCIDRLLAIEAKSHIPPALIALLQDENDLSFELDLMAYQFADRGREAVIADARKLTTAEGRLCLEGRPISMTVNKFRISTPNSPNHCWKDGFEQRYASFLGTQLKQQVVSVNNFAGMSLAEDKSLLGMLHSEPIRTCLTDEQRQFIDQHVLWTHRLEDIHVLWQGDETDLLSLVRNNREQFVIKPANEGRGFRVVVGPWADDEQWEQACTIDSDMPKIVQQFTPSVCFPVLSRHEGQLTNASMYLTLGLAMIDRQFQGVISRVSANPVTNVARDGYVQAALVADV